MFADGKAQIIAEKKISVNQRERNLRRSARKKYISRRWTQIEYADGCSAENFYSYNPKK
jgi:hypothetical protein